MDLSTRRSVLRGAFTVLSFGSIGRTVAAFDAVLRIDVSFPTSPTVGEDVGFGITVDVPDLIGTTESELHVTLSVDGEVVSQETTEVETGETTSLTLSHTFDEPGDHDVTMGAEVTLFGETYGNSVTQTLSVLDGFTISGASITIPDVISDDVADIRNHLDGEVDLGTKACLVVNEDQQLLVFTDVMPMDGRADGRGVIVDETFKLSEVNIDVVSAHSVSFSQERTEIRLDTLYGSPTEFGFEVVRINADHICAPYRTTGDEVPVEYANTSGILVEDRPELESVFGDIADDLHRALHEPTSETIEQLVSSPYPPFAFTTAFGTDFFNATTTTVDGIVVPSGTVGSELLEGLDQKNVVYSDDSAPLVYLIDREYDANTVDSIAEIREEIHELDGEIVELEAAVRQSTVSVKKTMEAFTACGEDLVQIDRTCVPIVHDVLLHGGVAWKNPKPSEDDLIGVIGLSSNPQTDPIAARDGRYDLLAEVVDTSRIHDSIPEDVILVVYDMERIDDVGFEELPVDVREMIQYRIDGVVDEWARQVEIEDDELRFEATRSDYGNAEGIVDTTGLRTAVDDWRGGDIDTNLLREVVDAWRSGENVD